MDDSDKNENLKPIIEDIVNTINEEEVDENFVEKVLQRLLSLSYTPKEEDSWVIAFCIQKVENHIKNSCNVFSIPNGLIEIAIDRICGEFLFSKKQSGQLSNEFDLDVAVKQVQAGDTNVTFAVNEGSETTETRLNKLIQYLMSIGESDFVCYRQIKW